ncbi:MAG: serine/threonine-protein kinase, partial [Streptosporangiaceae bacterium]
EGGQGVVYLGRDGAGTLVTVKLLRGGSAASGRARNRFIREADAARRVVAPHTARILDAEVTGDRPYIVSEFVEGPTLHRVVITRGPLTGGELRKLALRTAAALTAIHKAGIVHRDFKPGNVVIGRQGAKVIDFGVARSLDSETPQTSHPVGTPAYMAPEQIEDHPIGPPADVFAWGAAMVYAASGRPPFGEGPSSAAVMRRIVDREPDLGALKGSLRGLVARCLDKEPAARPTAAEIVRFLRSDATPAPKPTKIPAYRTQMIWALGLAILLGFTLGIILSAR